MSKRMKIFNENVEYNLSDSCIYIDNSNLTYEEAVKIADELIKLLNIESPLGWNVRNSFTYTKVIPILEYIDVSE